MGGILSRCYPRPVEGRKTYTFARHNVQEVGSQYTHVRGCDKEAQVARA